jgi:hypothetical protein
MRWKVQGLRFQDRIFSREEREGGEGHEVFREGIEATFLGVGKDDATVTEGARLCVAATS